MNIPLVNVNNHSNDDKVIDNDDNDSNDSNDNHLDLLSHGGIDTASYSMTFFMDVAISLLPLLSSSISYIHYFREEKLLTCFEFHRFNRITAHPVRDSIHSHEIFNVNVSTHDIFISTQTSHRLEWLNECRIKHSCTTTCMSVPSAATKASE
jgi:hypothetical protein